MPTLAPHREYSPAGELLFHLRELHVNQDYIIRHKRRFNVLACGRRFGKTILGVDRIAHAMLDGQPCGWFAPDYKTLNDAWRDIKRTFRPITTVSSEVEHRIEITTGGSVECWSLENNDDAGRSRKYGCVVIDEGAHAKNLPTVWTNAIMPTLMDLTGEAWFLSSPKGSNYFRSLWLRGQDQTDELPDGQHHRWPKWASWQFSSYDNPYLTAEDIDDIRMELEEEGKPFVEAQEIGGKFLQQVGMFFDAWSERVHVVDSEPVPQWWDWFGGFDFASGARGNWCFLLCCTDQAGNIHVVAERYGRLMLPVQQADIVVDCIRSFGIDIDRVLIACDDSMFPSNNPAERVGEYPVEALYAQGLSCIKSVKSRVPGWTRLKELLHQRTLELQGKDHGPGLRVYRGKCPNLVRTLPLMEYDERESRQDDMNSDLEDHCLDALRYAVMSRPQASVRPIAAQTPQERAALGADLAYLAAKPRYDPMTAGWDWVKELERMKGTR